MVGFEHDASGAETGRPDTIRNVWIPARSEKQVMEWSLVLASQNIACAIHPPIGDIGWALEVAPEDVTRSLSVIRVFLAENRDWRAPAHPEATGLLFHGGAFLWCFLLLTIHWAVEAPGSALEALGAFATRSTAHGEWWRPLTATFLHGSLDHLTANLTTGFLLLGLAMGRFGVGPALLLSLLAGVGGNLFAWALRAREYTGLGASGVIMGALGMLAFSLVSDARAGRVDRSVLVRSLLGGVFLFVLLGTSLRSDVLAHAGGFIVGGFLAAILAFLPSRVATERPFDVAAAALYLLIGTVGWSLAIHLGHPA